MEDSAFNKLPAEARNRIWELTVAHPHGLRIDRYWPADIAKQPGITQTCKQIRDETMQMLYASNTFKVVIFLDTSQPLSTQSLINPDLPTRNPETMERSMDGDASSRQLRNWLDVLEPNVHSAVRQLVISFNSHKRWDTMSEAFHGKDWKPLATRLTDLGYTAPRVQTIIRQESYEALNLPQHPLTQAVMQVLHNQMKAWESRVVMETLRLHGFSARLVDGKECNIFASD